MSSFADRFVIGSWEECPPVAPISAEVLGGKALGLLHIPVSWVPPFVVLTKHFRELWDRSSSASVAVTKLPSEETAVLDRFVEMARSTNRRILVRSNSPRETGFSSRGAFRSIPTSYDAPELFQAVDNVLKQDPQLLATLQLAIEPALPGHMSNERRVSPRRSLWLVEDSDGRFQQERIEAARREQAPTLLAAASESEVLDVLRQLGGYLQTCGEGYFHCEWVWDRERVWIVQADPVQLPSEDLPANRYIRGADLWPFKFSPRWAGLKHFSSVEAGKWRKLRRPKIFEMCGLPTADVYLISGDDWKNGGGAANKELAADLEVLCQHLVVVRCDVNDENYTFLPTSPPSKNPKVLLSFMEEVFTNKQVPDSDWAFLIAHLVPARVSAMVQAFPAAERVRIDALWGFPDGLLHFPHDSYFFYPADRRVDRTVKYKGVCLLFHDDAWTYSDVGRPEDWESTLQVGEIETLADWALRLAKQLNQQVQLMALARIGGVRGATGCLPWHYTNFDIPPFTDSVRKLPMTKELKVLSTFEDLSSAFASDSTVQAYVLRPTPELRRESKFLEAVGRLVAKQDRPLYFEGSLLGHAYYMLSNAGAHVVPIVDEPVADTKPYYKLVRDEIPTIIKQAGGLARLRTLSKQDARILLARKLLEEAFEVWGARHGEGIGGELADVIEVVDALREQYGLPAEDLDAIRRKKRQSRGGFEKLVYLEETRPGTLDATSGTSAGLPLFEDDQVWHDSVRTGQPPDLHVLEPLDDKLPFRFEFSLVPPVKSGSAVSELSAATKNYNVVAKYEKDKLIVTLSRRKPEPPRDQLELFGGVDE